jgi:hypothetical protein
VVQRATGFEVGTEGGESFGQSHGISGHWQRIDSCANLRFSKSARQRLRATKIYADFE